MSDVDSPPSPRSHGPSLTTQIVIGLIVGTLIGWLWPEWGTKLVFLRSIFLNLIKSVIAPLVFSTIVVGIAGGGEAKKVGRMGLKALIYFEVVTTLAMLIGLVVVNVVQPGKGIQLQTKGTGMTVAASLAKSHPKGFVETLVHVFPSSIVEAAAHGEVLQIVTFSVLFAFAVSAAGKQGRPVFEMCEALSQVMFRFTGFIMRFAPFGVGAAMAHTVGHQGIAVLKNLGLLVGSLYAALILFVLLVLWPVALMARVPVRQFLQAVWEPFTIAFVTTSSEAALPRAMQEMVEFGVPKPIVGFVMPTGYSFNLDGSVLYLALASVFIAQAAEPSLGRHFGWSEQLAMMLTLVVTSKGVAGVPRGSLVVLLASLGSSLPEDLATAGVALIFGVDELMDMARTAVNVFGNCLATVVVARWEGEFDEEKARRYSPLDEPSPA
jgi:proton glutamate symport protein